MKYLFLYTNKSCNTSLDQITQKTNIKLIMIQF